MTVALSPSRLAGPLRERLPDAVVSADGPALLVKGERLADVARFLKEQPGLELDYLSYMTAVDYFDYFELVYQLLSLEHNHSLVLKARVYSRENPSVPSVVGVWRGADYQEREVYDLMGIRFEGHPNLKRIVLWEGFAGYPLRKDYV